jgi:hypothetical protein
MTVMLLVLLLQVRLLGTAASGWRYRLCRSLEQEVGLVETQRRVLYPRLSSVMVEQLRRLADEAEQPHRLI